MTYQGPQSWTFTSKSLLNEGQEDVAPSLELSSGWSPLHWDAQGNSDGNMAAIPETQLRSLNLLHVSPRNPLCSGAGSTPGGTCTWRDAGLQPGKCYRRESGQKSTALFTIAPSAPSVLSWTGQGHLLLISGAHTYTCTYCLTAPHSSGSHLCPCPPDIGSCSRAPSPCFSPSISSIPDDSSFNQTLGANHQVAQV